MTSVETFNCVRRLVPLLPVAQASLAVNAPFKKKKHFQSGIGKCETAPAAIHFQQW